MQLLAERLVEGFTVKDIERRQADVGNFLLAERNDG